MVQMVTNYSKRIQKNDLCSLAGHASSDGDCIVELRVLACGFHMQGPPKSFSPMPVCSQPACGMPLRGMLVWRMLLDLNGYIFYAS